MRVTRLALSLTALMALVMAAPAALAAEQLRPLGTVEYQPEPSTVERGTYVIKNEDRKIRSLRFEIDQGEADIRAFKIIYVDGEEERVRVRQVLKEGQRTDVFRLEEPRPVKSIEISYLPKGPVTIILLADARRPEPPPAEWQELGCKNVGFLIDQDSIIVKSQDRYSAIRLRSSGNEFELRELSLRLGDGQRENYQIRSVIQSGGRSNAIKLRSGSQRINQIDMLYRSRVISNQKTRLCIDGLVDDGQDNEDN
jgi:hypothetical protein